MSSLTLGQRQIVEVGKAIATQNLTVLCLDEPTAALNAGEGSSLLALLTRLKKEGTALVYVSHRLDELRVIADRVLVLRNGRNVGLLEIADVTAGGLASLMLGRIASERIASRSSAQPNAAAKAGPAELAVTDWTSSADPPLNGVSFDARAGEIVGLYGLAGSGVETVARGLGGLLSKRQLRGGLTLRGEVSSAFHSPIAARRNHVVLLPSDRAREGLLLPRPTGDSLTLGQLKNVSKLGFIQRKKEHELNARSVATFQIVATARAKQVGRLSGGNQQKVLLANRLSMQPRVLVLHEPTRGVDIGARAQIHRVVREAAEQQKAVVLITTDIDEVTAISDRILVFRGGRIVKELTGAQRTESDVLTAAAQEEPNEHNAS
jgi:ribose transport system ATP-binding protein